MPRVLAFGHSHMGALLEAYRTLEASPFELISYQFLRPDRPHIVNVDGVWRYHPDCERELRELIRSTEPALIVSMLQGDQAATRGLIAPDRPFDFYFPGEEGEREASAEIVPFDLLFESCYSGYGLIIDLLGRMKDAIAEPALALSPPPIVGADEYILKSNSEQANIGPSIAERGLPAMDWRYRIWKLHVMTLRSIYEARGIRFIVPPRETYDDDGFLRQPFWSDLLHANAAYGRLLLQQVGSFLATGF